MALPTCPKCSGHVFELRDHSPQRSRYAYSFIQCASCGVVVGVVDGLNTGAKLAHHDDVLEKIAAKLGVAWRKPD